MEVGPGVDAVAWPCVERLPPPPASALWAAANKIMAAANQPVVRNKLLEIDPLVMASFPGQLGGCGAPAWLRRMTMISPRRRLTCVYRRSD